MASSVLYRSLILFLLLTSVSVNGQRIINQLPMSDELPVDVGTSLSQCDDGFYWIGGSSGLFRFDGHLLKRFPIQATDSKVVHSQNVQSPMFSDANGKLWLSTTNALHSFNPVDDRFRTYQLHRNGIPLSNDYRPFYLDSSKQELWLSAGGNIWRFDVNSEEYYQLADSTSAVDFSVWQTPEAPEEYRVVGGRWIFPGLEVTDIYPGNRVHISRELKTDHYVRCSYPISRDSILLGTEAGVKLLIFEKDDFVITELLDKGPVAYVADMVLASKGTLLISYLGKGIFPFDIRSRKFSKPFASPSELVGKRNDQLLYNRDGDVLVSHPSEGIDVVYARESPFRAETAPDDFPSNLAIGPNDTKFMLTHTSGIYQQKAGQKAWQEIPVSPEKSISIAQQFTVYENQLVLVCDQYIATVNPETGKYERYFTSEKLFGGRLNTTEGNRLLLTEIGLRQFTISQDGQVLTRPVQGIETEGGQIFTGVFTLSDSLILLAFQGTDIWTAKVSEAADFEVVSRVSFPAAIYQASRSSNGSALIGTNNGLYRLQDTTSTLLFNGNKRFSNLSILSFVEDGNGTVWLGTDSGLFAYNLLTNKSTYYDKIDGLPSNRFEPVRPVVEQNGRIWMLTDAGIFSFHPNEVGNQVASIVPYVDQIWVNDVLLEQSVQNIFANGLNLPYRRNSVNLKISGVGLEDSPQAGIEHQLIGYEKNQAQVEFGQTVPYPNLPPGTYTLQLTAINRNGLPSGKKKLQITILPPWWDTWWFRTLAVLAVALIASGIYGAGLRRERLKQQRLLDQQARLAAERDRIAGEVHDDLGGQISSILYLSEEILLMGEGDDNEHPLQRINELSRNSLQNVRDIIFALDNRRATLADLGEQLRGAGTDFFTDRNIGFTCTDTFDHPDFPLTSRQKRNLILILKETWHNTAKHAEASQINLDIREVRGLLQISCSDNGKGFTTTKAEKGTGGYGLDNMTQKATAIGASARLESTPGEGTTLYLNWPLDLREGKTTTQ